jgi:hypothetical protein
MMKRSWKFKMIAIVLAGIVALGAIFMWVWNWLVPELFNGPIINFAQALGIMLLSRILFRGFHRPCGGRYNSWGHWKNKMENMSPEEREKMRELWKKRCGGWNCDDDKNKPQ